MAEIRTETGRALLAHIERLDYDAYDAARALMQERGEAGDWADVIATIESEAVAAESPA